MFWSILPLIFGFGNVGSSEIFSVFSRKKCFLENKSHRKNWTFFAEKKKRAVGKSEEGPTKIGLI